MNLEELQLVLDENPELLAEVLKTNVNDDLVKNYLADDTKQHLIQPTIDSAVSKGIESYKRNNFDSAVDKAVAERFPAETPEQIALQKVQNEVVTLRKEKERESLLNYAMRIGTEKGLDAKFTNFIMGDSQETIRTNANVLAIELDAMIEKGVESRMQATGQASKPQASASTHTGVTDKPIGEYDYDEIDELFRTNPTLASQMFG